MTAGCIIRTFLGLAFIIAQALAAAPTEFPEIPGVKIAPSGDLTVAGIRTGVTLIDTKWGQSRQETLVAQNGYPRAHDKTRAWVNRGTLALKTHPDIPLRFLQRISPVAQDPQAMRLEWEVVPASPDASAPLREAAWQLFLPVKRYDGRQLRIDDTTLTLSADDTGQPFPNLRSAERTLAIPVDDNASLVITGKFGITLQDMRRWGTPAWVVRIRFLQRNNTGTQEQPTLARAALEVRLRYQPHRSTVLDLRPVANRAFVDEVAGDNRGGWTDQGSEQDLRALKPGLLDTSGIAFDIIDPASNNNKAALVLGRIGQPELPRSATLTLPAAPSASGASPSDPPRNLYLLHAAAWLPIESEPVGTVAIRNTDGTTTRRDILANRDIADWWSPSTRPNAIPAWTADNTQATVALYLTRLPLDPAKTPAAITFETTGDSMWMIAAASTSPDDIPVTGTRVPLAIQAGKDWAPYHHTLEIRSGSVFDFSPHVLAGAPAGKNGPLIATPDGHFAFEQKPGRPVRFWGVNLCFSANFLENDEADRLADRLARSGYNTVRLHHYDRDITLPGQNSWDIDPAKLDRLDYLFAALKKRGIYINIDLYSARYFSEAELRSFGLDTTLRPNAHRRNFKALFPITPAMFESWKKFAQNLLLHKNAYTGLTWAEDPALIGICPLNEDNLVTNLTTPLAISRYEAAYAAAHPDSPDPAQDPAAWNRFLYEAQISSDARIFDFLRNTLKTRALLTGANYRGYQGLSYVREHYDYVDNHTYWDHPNFPRAAWSPPYSFSQRNATRLAARVPRTTMPTRIPGKPFVITEFNYCRPNATRAEGSVLMPAYASLQDWDALYNFQYAHDRDTALHGAVENYFAIAADPVGLIGDRVGALLFLRRDIAPATRTIVYATAPDEAFAKMTTPFPESFSQLGLVTRIGSFPGAPADLLGKTFPGELNLAALVTGSATLAGSAPRAPVRTWTADNQLAANLVNAGILPSGSISDDGRSYTSETGQIELSTLPGTLKVVTPRGEHFIAAPSARLSGDRVTIRNGDVPATLSIVAVDDAPLATTRRILVTHLTNSLPAGARFEHTDQKLLLGWGKGPHLVQRGSTELALRLPSGDWRAWAVDASGERVREVKLQHKNNQFVLIADTVTDEGTQLAYELTR
ncbi:Cellulase (glycosyl hydrolase family 5) [Opitutaceae bacterium TAV1]|nr:Cellulase (glycosyl hydrolase family 5) [Opitutaceae bacterium TAV1]